MPSPHFQQAAGRLRPVREKVVYTEPSERKHTNNFEDHYLSTQSVR